MNNNTSVLKLVEFLQSHGESEQSVEIVLQEITKAASAKAYLEMVSLLTEDDLKSIDGSLSEDEANTQIRMLYASRSGSSPEAIISKFLGDFVDSFIQSYQSDKGSALANPVQAS